MTPDGVACGGFENRADQGAGYLGSEDDWHALGGDFARAEAADGAAGGWADKRQVRRKAAIADESVTADFKFFI